MANFRVIHGQKTVWDIFDLVEGLFTASNFIQVFPVNFKIPMGRIDNVVLCTQLIEEKTFTDGANGRLRRQCVHQVGVFTIDFGRA